jgi:hypothetical protein
MSLMPNHFATLKAAYPTVIARMPDVFNAINLFWN